EQDEHRRREDVDALRAIDLVDEHADRERDRHDYRADPRSPAQRAHRAREARLACADALERERGAAREECIRRRIGADHLGRRARCPCAIVVAPEITPPVRDFRRTDRRDLQRRGFIHAAGILPARASNPELLVARDRPHQRWPVEAIPGSSPPGAFAGSSCRVRRLTARAYARGVCGLMNTAMISGCDSRSRCSMSTTCVSMSVAVSSSANSRLSATMIWLGESCTVTMPLTRAPGVTASAMRRVDATSVRDAGSPMRRLLLSRASSSDTTPSTTPIRIDAMPSASGQPNCAATKMPAAAITMPTSAALSSNSTMKVAGSL